MTFGALGTLGSFNRLGAGAGRLSGFIPGAALDLRYADGRYLLNGSVYGSPVSVPNLSFVRSGARTATGSEGVVREFASGVRRIVPGEGLRVTAGATNLLTYSEDFSNAVWVNFGASGLVTADQTSAPDGSSTADLISTGGSGQGVFQSQAITSGATITGSIFLRAGTATQSRLILRDSANGANACALVIDWASGVASVQTATEGGTFTGAVGAIISLGGGWYRASLTCNAIGSSNVKQEFEPSRGAAGNCFTWGAQLETGSVATDYIPTTTASASAGDDEETFDLGLSGGKWTNLGGLDPSAGFTVLVDAVRAEGSAANSSNAVLASLRAGSNSADRIFLYNISGREGVFVEAADVTQAALDSGVVTAAGGQVRMAARIATNNVAVSVNGGSVLSDTSVTLPDFTGMTLNVGAGAAAGVAPVNGFIRRIAIIPGALSDAHLQVLTS